MAFMKKFHDLEIQLEDIRSATNNFGDENIIGIGAFGKVYRGSSTHSHSKRQILAAFKRLDRRYGQGDPKVAFVSWN
ncbi:putative kinase-like domain superfamily, kinase, ATP binding protein [Helianthus anomalus]